MEIIKQDAKKELQNLKVRNQDDNNRYRNKTEMEIKCLKQEMREMRQTNIYLQRELKNTKNKTTEVRTIKEKSQIKFQKRTDIRVHSTNKRTSNDTKYNIIQNIFNNTIYTNQHINIRIEQPKDKYNFIISYFPVLIVILEILLIFRCVYMFINMFLQIKYIAAFCIIWKINDILNGNKNEMLIKSFPYITIFVDMFFTMVECYPEWNLRTPGNALWIFFKCDTCTSCLFFITIIYLFYLRKPLVDDKKSSRKTEIVGKKYK